MENCLRTPPSGAIVDRWRDDEVVRTAVDERVHDAVVFDAVRHVPAQGVRAPSVGPDLRRGQRSAAANGPGHLGVTGWVSPACFLQ